MKGKALHLSLGFLLPGFLGAPLAAEQPAATSTAGANAASRRLAARPQVASVFGTQTNILQIPASSFVPRGAATVIGYDTNGYVYRSAGFVDFAWATVTLPSGVDLDFLDLYYCDTNAANDLTARLRSFTGWNDANIGFADLISVSSFGSAGCDYTFAPGGGIFRPDGVLPDFDHTVNNDVRYNGGYQYTIVVSSTVTDSTLSFKGVDIWYHRQVSPAPGTATFTDVPTGHPYFRFIEALNASGITAGCGGGNYCPGNAVTRGEIAVFLAKALGLHFPN
jgi:hypothetical protein